MHVVVTGAFGYSGRYMAQRLLDAGHTVTTLTHSPHRANPFAGRVKAIPFHFDDPDALAASLAGVDALINTYWVRFDHPLFTHEQAVANTRNMFQAARQAGVQRIVHISITNPDIHSNLPYFRGKAQVEADLRDLGVSYCILRPTVLFGKEDVLINNIAWGLRRLPVFPVFGSGEYRLQPIYVDDLAAVAVEQAARTDSRTIDAIGPETYTYRSLVETIARQLDLRRPIISVPPGVGSWGARLVGWWVGDVVITREEIRGLMEERLYVTSPPLGATWLSEWVAEHQDTLGRTYTSEIARRLDRISSYQADG
jgi:NADH dehydrogenase